MNSSKAAGDKNEEQEVARTTGPSVDPNASKSAGGVVDELANLNLSQQPMQVEQSIDYSCPMDQEGVDMLDKFSPAYQGIWQIAKNAYELAALKDPERAKQFAFIVCQGEAVLRIPANRYLVEKFDLPALDARLTAIRINPSTPFPSQFMTNESEFRSIVRSALHRHILRQAEAVSAINYQMLATEIVYACAEFLTPDWICACGPIHSIAAQNGKVLLDEAALRATGGFAWCDYRHQSKSTDVEVFLWKNRSSRLDQPAEHPLPKLAVRRLGFEDFFR